MKKALWLTAILIMGVVGYQLLRSFFLPEYLSKAINANEVSSWQLDYARTLKLPEYYQYLRKQNQPGSSLWLQASRELAKDNTKYSLEIADFYLTNQDSQQAEFWLLQANKKRHVPALALLAQFYFQQGRYAEMKNHLLADQYQSDVAENEVLLSLLAEVALIEGHKTKAKSYYQQIKALSPTSEFIKNVEMFNVFSDSMPAVASNSCPVSIQMYATNLADLKRVKALLNYASGHELSQFICFDAPRYVSLNALNCKHSNKERIQCDPSVVKRKFTQKDSNYIGIMVPSGGANVNHGTLYLDRDDIPLVFLHELSHLLGFIDEYPLPLNHSKCLSAQAEPFSHNVAVLPSVMFGERERVRQKVLAQLPWSNWINRETPILQAYGKGWRLGTPAHLNHQVGLFASATCNGERGVKTEDGIDVQSYKAISSLTPLEYFELSFPQVYSEFLRQNPTRFLMASPNKNSVTKS